MKPDDLDPTRGDPAHTGPAHLGPEPPTPEPDPPDPEVIGVRHGLFGTPGTGDTSGYGGLVQPITLLPSSTRPYGGYFDEIADALERELADRYDAAVEKIVIFRDEMTIHVRRDHLPTVALTLRNCPDLRFELCLGVNGVHYPGDPGRELHAVYPLASLTHNRRVRLEVSAPDADPHIPSICDIYPTNDWHERETYDFFGIVFDGHRSLTRIEMPDDWEGHPQRKDYPLGGVPVEYKGTRVDPPDRRRSYS